MAFFEDHLARTGRWLDEFCGAVVETAAAKWNGDSGGVRTLSGRLSDWWQRASPAAHRTVFISAGGAVLLIGVVVTRSILSEPAPKPPSQEAQQAYAELQRKIGEGMKARNDAARMGTTPGRAGQRSSAPPPASRSPLGLPPR